MNGLFLASISNVVQLFLQINDIFFLKDFVAKSTLFVYIAFFSFKSHISSNVTFLYLLNYKKNCYVLNTVAAENNFVVFLLPQFTIYNYNTHKIYRNAVKKVNTNLFLVPSNNDD